MTTETKAALVLACLAAVTAFVGGLARLVGSGRHVTRQSIARATIMPAMLGFALSLIWVELIGSRVLILYGITLFVGLGGMGVTDLAIYLLHKLGSLARKFSDAVKEAEEELTQLKDRIQNTDGLDEPPSRPVIPIDSKELPSHPAISEDTDEQR